MGDAFSVDLDDREVVQWIDELPDKVRSAVQGKLSAVADALKAKVASELSGGLVKVRSGELLASLGANVESIGDKAKATVSTSAAYAGALEYGVHKAEHVAEARRDITVVFGQTKADVLAIVRPHDRLMNIKGRDFMGLAAQDATAAVVDEMASAVSQALED